MGVEKGRVKCFLGLERADEALVLGLRVRASRRRRTLEPGAMWTASTPASTAAASLERKGFQTRYSTCGGWLGWLG